MDEPARQTARDRVAPQLRAASVACDNCGRETPHRVLNLDRRAYRSGFGARGVARCRECGWTHPFEVRFLSDVTVATVISDGPKSLRRETRLPSGKRVQVGSDVPGSSEPMRILRIDDREGRQVPSAVSSEIRTLWVRPDRGAILPVSVVQGRRTWSTRLTMPPDALIAVGTELRIDDTRIRVVALRVRGTNSRRVGDGFRAQEIQRVYGRRAEMPPAGRSRWSTDRATPSSRASRDSVASRSRSGPGVRKKRIVPRARMAAGGAAMRSESPS